VPPADALTRVRTWYGERGLPARLQVVPAELAGELGARLDADGWATDAPTAVLTASLGPVLRRGRSPDSPSLDVGVRIDDAPDDDWLATYRADAGPLPDVARALLSNHDSVGFVSLREAGRCIAIARVTVDRRWAGLSCVEVVADRRRAGLGSMVSRAALEWAAGRGGRYAVLQVMADDATARAAYDALGFVVHHDYEYRSPPTG
jgi:N-acetylglutamate synthase